MGNNFSPGPWHVGIKIDGYGWPTYRLRDMNDPHDEEEYTANAALIASAPDLLEALETLLDCVEVWLVDGFPTTDGLPTEVEELARAAIAAATE